MFDKFGEFDSAEELNKAALAQRQQGDEEALVALAIENGIDREDAEDFMDGAYTVLCNEYMAALGKLKVECEALKLSRELLMLTEELEGICQIDQTVAAGVRKKGRSLAGYLARVIDLGFKNAVTPPKEVLDQLKEVPQQYRGQMKTGMPDKSERLGLIAEYYGR